MSIATLLMASCVSFSDIKTGAPVRTPADYATSESLPAQAGQWPAMSWASEIGGPALQALIDEALAQNPNLQVAAARVAAARAVTESAHAAERPAFRGSFESTYQRYSEHYIFPPPLAGNFETDNRLTLDASYDLDFWGRHDADLRSALSQGKAAEAEQYAARLMLTTSIARAWVQLARQHAQLDLIGQQIELRQKMDRLTKLRYGAGLDTQSESELSRQQIAGLRSEQMQWQESIALTRNQLAALLGQGPDRGQRIPRPMLPQTAATTLPNELPLTLLGRRPDIVASRWKVEATLGDIDSAKAQFYPNVNLVGFAGFTSIGLSNLLQSGSQIAGIGPAIHVPVFERAALRAQLKGRTASYDAAVATYNQTLTDALREVADQVQSLRTAEQQSEQQHIATQAATNSLKLARDRERVGTSNMLPVLASEMSLLSQRRIELDLTARRSDLRIGLIKALGGGFDAAAEGLMPADDARHASTPLNRSTSEKSAS